MYFSNATLEFLSDLAKNNDRAWFEANKARFEADVREPALRFIEDAAGWLEMEGLPYRGEAKKVGGSLNRIHRDTRFSADKTPYHTHITLHFGHVEGSKERLMPMLGLRFAPGDAGMGGGIYAAPTPELNRIRDAIVAAPEAWKRATEGLELWGDSLKTAPKGYDKEHPLIEDLRRKAFMASATFSEADLTGDLMGAFQRGTRRVKPLCDFLAHALR